MAAIVGGLIWIGNQEEIYTPSAEVTPSTYRPNNHREYDDYKAQFPDKGK